jgi:hypothetical protein
MSQHNLIKSELIYALRQHCGHDSRSVDGCLTCIAADRISELEQKYYQNHAELLQIHKMVMSPADHGLEPTGYTAKAVKAIIDQWHRTSDKNAKHHSDRSQEVK